MIFLIEYDRKRGSVAGLREFPDAGHSEADEARIELEADLLRQGTNREVAILQADSLQALQRTHRRYFADLAELVRQARHAD